MIKRRHFTQLLMAAPFGLAGCSDGMAAASQAQKISGNEFSYRPGIISREPLMAPHGRQIQVAFAINPGVQVIDLAGPWETFQDTYLAADTEQPAFRMFTVSEKRVPLRGSGGLMITPDFTIDNAPVPDVIVVPHFSQPSPFAADRSAIHNWIRDASGRSALTMSVCTGAFQLAKTGLLDGIPVTTNQQAYANFAKTFPHIDLRRGPRFVEAGRIATAGGLSAGIDLALRVVARYFDDGVAQRTADTMEYVGTGWRA